MARVDSERDQVVVRLVYDGPAWAGKTTNLRRLSAALGVELVSGEEADGRTLHLDWAAYVGGLFEGRPIHCQIVTVPGQRVLERRRRFLLDSADAVIFVADSSPAQIDENLHSFGLLRGIAAVASPPVGIVVQANKRDLVDAVPLEVLRDRLAGGPTVAMTEAVAEHGDGIRETFVLAVRLALDRVRALRALGRLRGEGAVDDSPASLLAAMRSAEGVAAAGGAAEAGAAPSAGSSRAMQGSFNLPGTDELTPPRARAAGPRLPDATLPSGFIWPPVSGRVWLHDGSREAAEVSRSPSGDWLARSKNWRLMSPMLALYDDLEEGRRALIDWARWHTAARGRVSPVRTVALVEAAPGAWRLWQAVRGVATLRDECRALIGRPDPEIGEGLFRIVDLRLRAEQELVMAGWLPRLDLERVSVSEVGEPIYSGFAPFPAAVPESPSPPRADERRILEEELVPALLGELALAPSRLPAVLSGLEAAAQARDRRHVAEAVRRSLMER